MKVDGGRRRNCPWHGVINWARCRFLASRCFLPSVFMDSGMDFFFTLLDSYFPSFIDPRTGAKRMRARFARRGTQRLTGEASED